MDFLKNLARIGRFLGASFLGASFLGASFFGASFFGAMALSPASAESSLPTPGNPLLSSVQYSADVAYSSKQMQGAGKIYHAAPNVERREVNMMGRNSVMIMNKKDMFVLMPEMNTAMRMNMAEDPITTALQKTENSAVTFTKTGTETINGEKTTKYKLGGEAQGTFWVTDDGILVRADIPMNGDNMAFNVTNIKRGPQPKTLFEIPAGMKVMDKMEMGTLLRALQPQ